MEHELSLKEVQKEWHGSWKSYIIGFISCILLTVIAYYLVFARQLIEPVLIVSVIGLAVIQAVVQLLFFLHVGQEAKPRWETLVFLFMVLVLLIVAAGTLWIMHDLNNRVMSGMIEVP